MYQELLNEARELNVQVNKYRANGEHMCSVCLQQGYMTAVAVLERHGEIDKNEKNLLITELQKQQEKR